jgi:hypothetical protein
MDPPETGRLGAYRRRSGDSRSSSSRKFDSSAASYASRRLATFLMVLPLPQLAATIFQRWLALAESLY